MRFSILTIAALAGAAFAQLEQLPSCAQSCVNKFTTGGNIGGCPSLDIKCICSSPTFLSDIACCLAGDCDTSDQEKATDFAQSFCKISGVTNLPSAVSCTSTAASTSTSASSASSASTTSSGSSSITSPASVASQSGTSSSTSATSTPNAGAQNGAGVGAGILGGVAAFAAALL